MHTQIRNGRTWSAWLGAAVAALMLVIAGAATGATLPAATGTFDTPSNTRTFELWAKTGSATMPGSVAVAIWGYADTAVGTATLPGPVMIANQGETVQVILHNMLSESTSLLFQGQAMVPDTTGAIAGATKTYSFTASNPGTFLYEAGLLANAQHQAAMGLYGALIVRPLTANQAYDDVATAYDDEALLVLGEIDPALAANPAGFDMRNYAPKYFVINGKAYKDTDPIPTTAGNKLLLRYVNAGIQHHSMAVLGLRQNFVAKGGNLLPTRTRNVVAESLAPGETGDAIATVPTLAAGGSKFAVYDGNLMLHNNGAAGYGGMLTFVTLAGTGPDHTGPSTTGTTLAPNPTNGTVSVALGATVSDAASGNANVTAAEYFIDASGANGTGAPMSGTFGAPGQAPAVSTVGVNATISVATLTALASGKHNVYVHGKDENDNWGAFNVAVLNLDKTGPSTTGLMLNPNPTNGSVPVVISATGNDSATGGSNVTAAEYTIDAGAPVAITPNVSAPIVSLSATIPAATMTALAAGPHTVSIRSRDAFGNWGTPATTTLNKVVAGPVTSNVIAAPNPNNGALPLNSSNAVVRVTATMTSTGSTVAAAEASIDAGPAFPMLPSDGLFNGASEVGYADIPLSTINQLSNGNHSISVRGRDAAGNWGLTNSTTLVIDKAPPTASAVTLTPSASNNTAVVLGASASDTASGNSNIVAGEYFINVLGTAGTGSAMTPAAASPSTTLSATIPAPTVAGLATGNRTIYVRTRDAAGNWSAAATGTLLIDRTAPTFSSITLAASTIAAGTASVNLAVNGAADPLVSGLASGVAAGEYWVCPSTCVNPAAGSGTSFNGLTASIPTAALLAGQQYTVRARIRDGAGNWSTGTNGVRSAVLTVTPAANAVFTDGFESGALPGNWSSASTGTTSRLSATAGAALFGAVGMQAQGNNTNYVQSNVGPTAAAYDARFYFQPNANSSTGKDIFAAATASGFGTTLFHVRYRLSGAQAQVQIQVGSTANPSWTNISGSSTSAIEVVWQSGSTLQLYVNGTLSQTLTATSGSVGAVRLGSVTNTGNNTLMYFDAFSSKRSASPLVGP